MLAWLLLFFPLITVHSLETSFQPRGPRPVSGPVRPVGWFKPSRRGSSQIKVPARPEGQSIVPPPPATDGSVKVPKPPTWNDQFIVPPPPTTDGPVKVPERPTWNDQSIVPPPPTTDGLIKVPIARTTVGQSKVTPPPKPDGPIKGQQPETGTEATATQPKKTTPETTTAPSERTTKTATTVSRPKQPWEKDCYWPWNWYTEQFRASIARKILALYKQSMEYDCVLEALANVRLTNPKYYELIRRDMNVVALDYEFRSDQYVIENVTEAATKQWTPYLKALCSLYSFGCNFSSNLVRVPYAYPQISLYSYKLSCLFFFTPM